MISTSLDDFLARIGNEQQLRSRGIGKWIMRCPVHTDHHASLLVDARRFGPNAGAVSFTCLAGCAFRDIAQAFEVAGLLESDRRVRLGSVRSATQTPVVDQRKDESQEHRHLNAAKRIRGILTYAIPANPDHPYLVAKGIRPNGALQYKGSLLLPLVDFDGAVWSAQFIQADGRKANSKQSRRGKTFFQLPGATDLIFVTEGFSTGATVHEATGYSVYCAMGLSNVRWLTTELVQRFGSERVVIAADNDAHQANNPGLTVACQIADDLQVRVVWPDATEGSKTDWNDYHRKHGQSAVSAAITQQLTHRG
jgi:phage/plasmid primase-like uncharacterized protein